MARLTKKLVESITPSAKPVYVWDDQLKGFGVKVLPNGQRKYVVKYRVGAGGRSAQQRWLQLGTHGPLTADRARDLAHQALAAAMKGHDPQADKQLSREAPSMIDLWQRYESDHLPRKKASSAANDRQNWRVYVLPALGSRKAGQVTRNDVDRLHKSLAATPYQANRVVALLSKVFSLAERWGMRPQGSNPCHQLEKYQERPRERFLSVAELTRLGEAMREGLAAGTETPAMIGAVRLLLLTGARLNEVLGARWDWIDFDRRVIRLPDSKTGAKLLYLSEPALDVLCWLKDNEPAGGSPYVIPGRIADQHLINLRMPWLRLCKRAGLEGVRIHDLRHTAASIGVAHGMSLPIIGRLLGHTQASTTNRYAHVGLDPALAAADRIGASISAAIGDPGAPPTGRRSS